MMPGFLVTENADIRCAHSGAARPMSGNPKVLFGAPGAYTATMTLNGTYQKSLTITIGDACRADTIPGNAVVLGVSCIT